MKSLHTEIIINAAPEKVWGILMDFNNYPKWNPFIVSISGKTIIGSKLKVKLKQPSGKTFNFSPKCTEFKENQELKWQGHFIIPGIFDGEHSFKLRSVEGGKTKFIHSENFKGLLLSRMWKDLNTNTLKGFEMMNSALKKQAEESA